MSQTTPSDPKPLRGQTRICKSVLAYNTADLSGHSLWDLTGVQALFDAKPVVASEGVYSIAVRHMPVGRRVPPEAIADYAKLLGSSTAIIAHVLTEPPASAAYWPVAPEMLESFLEADTSVAIIGEGAGFVRLLLVGRDAEALLRLTHLAMCGTVPAG